MSAAFQERKPLRKIKRNYSQKLSQHPHTHNTAHDKKSPRFESIFSKVLLGTGIFFFLGLIVLYIKIIAPLPSVEELENLEIAQSSTIYDKDGNELYKIFEEKRTYWEYENISKNMVNAIVAGEDKRYWENPGVDFIGLFRAFIYGIIGKNEGFGGTSTLTQQLIRNTIIENRSSSESIFQKLERKIKEIYLAFRLTNGVSKEKILELYLNKISYGSNAYGIEQAARTFYNKSSKDLTVLEASMLASLPKGPSYYSPYNNFERLVGYPYTYEGKDDENVVKLITKENLEASKEQVETLKKYISGFKTEKYSETEALICGLKKDFVKSNISVDSDGCSVIKYTDFLTLLNGIAIPYGEKDSEKFIEYQTGRKDFILGRMLEDKYISFDEYKEALISSIGFEFKRYKEDIKHPYFVFYVKQYLEEKYGQDLLEKGGLKIYTSLDPKLQDEAEKIVEKYGASNASRFNAKNAALISINNETGEILAMVGGRDYFDEENKGNINMTLASLQPGSSFKPFVYSVAIDKELIGSKSPVYDVATTFPGGYKPKNFDGRFMGKMTVASALNHSRNIPAVKMYYLAGGESAIEDWMNKLGVKSISQFKKDYFENHGKEYNYGASMALGSATLSPLEMAEAYSVYANLGYKKQTIPVIKVLDAKGVVIEEFDPKKNTGTEVISPATAYIMNKILSDTTARPSGWNSFITLGDRPVASKTGTSTKQSSSTDKVIYPRNLWTIGYTPQITTVVWAGNADGSATNLSGDGLNAAGPIWRDFMKAAHSGKPALDWKQPAGVKEVNISKISGMLAPGDMDTNFIIRSLFKNVPQTYDTGIREAEVDLLCNGTISENTPESAKGKVQLVAFRSERPDDPAWEGPVQAWVAAKGYEEEFGPLGNFVTSIKKETCERSGGIPEIQVGAKIQDGDTLVNGSNYLEVGYKSSTNIQKIEVFLDTTLIHEVTLGEKSEGIYTGDMNIPQGTEGQHTLEIRVVDAQYYAKSMSYSINVIKNDETAPEIIFTNPEDGSISLYKGDVFNLRGKVEDKGNVRSINIYRDETPLAIGVSGREFTQEISSQELEVGEYTIIVEAVDMDFNKSQKSVTLTVLEK